MSTQQPKRDLHAEITSQLIAAIEADPGRPSLPWRRTGGALHLPHNILSGMTYNGINILSLWVTAQSRDYATPIWGTYRQWAECGAQVRKGEKSALVIFYKEYETNSDPEDETDNLTRAADQMNVSQSALSMQIAKLELELGHSLFERRGRQLLLTEAGRIALDHADTIFAAGAELLGTLGEQRSQLRQVLRVGAIATLSRNFQIGFLKPVLDRNDVELVLRSGNYADLLAALEAHRLDVVLTNAALSRDAATPWVAHRIAEQPVSVIGSRGFASAGRGLAELLASEPLIVPTPESSIRAGFDALVERLGIRPTFAVEADDMAMLRLIARERTGLAILPPIVVRDELASGVLTEITRLPDLVETFHAITLRRRFPNPLLGELLGGSEAHDDSSPGTAGPR